MKKFKHSVAVKLSGIKGVDEAFKEKAVEVGYKLTHVSNEPEYFIFNFNGGKSQGEFGSWNHSGGFAYQRFILPEDFNKALSIIAEVEEEKEEFKIGDYVKNIDLDYYSSAGRYSDYKYDYPFIGRIVEITPDATRDNLPVFKIEVEEGMYCGKSINQVIKATPEEIKEHLIKEYGKKGFVIGANVQFEDSKGNITTGKIERFEYSYIGNSVCSEGKLQACYKGCYVSDVDLLKLLPSHPDITINGYKAEFKEWGLDFNNGCARIDKRIFARLNTIITDIKDGEMEGNKTITSVKIGAGEFTSAQIKQISEYYRNK